MKARTPGSPKALMVNAYHLNLITFNKLYSQTPYDSTVLTQLAGLAVQLSRQGQEYVDSALTPEESKIFLQNVIKVYECFKNIIVDSPKIVSLTSNELTPAVCDSWLEHFNHQLQTIASTTPENITTSTSENMDNGPDYQNSGMHQLSEAFRNLTSSSESTVNIETSGNDGKNKDDLSDESISEEIVSNPILLDEMTPSRQEFFKFLNYYLEKKSKNINLENEESQKEVNSIALLLAYVHGILKPDSDTNKNFEPLIQLLKLSIEKQDSLGIAFQKFFNNTPSITDILPFNLLIIDGAKQNSSEIMPVNVSKTDLSLNWLAGKLLNDIQETSTSRKFFKNFLIDTIKSFDFQNLTDKQSIENEKVFKVKILMLARMSRDAGSKLAEPLEKFISSAEVFPKHHEKLELRTTLSGNQNKNFSKTIDTLIYDNQRLPIDELKEKYAYKLFQFIMENKQSRHNAVFRGLLDGINSIANKLLTCHDQDSLFSIGVEVAELQMYLEKNSSHLSLKEKFVLPSTLTLLNNLHVEIMNRNNYFDDRATQKKYSALHQLEKQALSIASVIDKSKDNPLYLSNNTYKKVLDDANKFKDALLKELKKTPPDFNSIKELNISQRHSDLIELASLYETIQNIIRDNEIYFKDEKDINLDRIHQDLNSYNTNNKVETGKDITITPKDNNQFFYSFIYNNTALNGEVHLDLLVPSSETARNEEIKKLIFENKKDAFEKIINEEIKKQISPAEKLYAKIIAGLPKEKESKNPYTEKFKSQIEAIYNNKNQNLSDSQKYIEMCALIQSAVHKRKALGYGEKFMRFFGKKNFEDNQLNSLLRELKRDIKTKKYLPKFSNSKPQVARSNLTANSSTIFSPTATTNSTTTTTTTITTTPETPNNKRGRSKK